MWIAPEVEVRRQILENRIKRIEKIIIVKRF
jgi:hypothetical protein